MTGNGELNTISETADCSNGRSRDHDVKRDSRVVFDLFMDFSEDDDGPESTLTPGVARQHSLVFSMDICADSCGAQEETVGDAKISTDAAATLSDEETPEQRIEIFKKAGRDLKKISKNINEDYLQNNASVKKSTDSFIGHLASDAADKLFQKTLETVMDEFNGSFPNHEERYQVAMVMLFTKQTIKIMDSAVNVTKQTSECVIGSAMSYIGRHFPGWLETYST